MGKIIVQSIFAAVLFIVISVILEKDYSQAVWLEKGVNGGIFAVCYALFLIVRQKFIKKEHK